MFRISSLFLGASALPSLNYLDKGDCGTNEKDVDEEGVFGLSISVAGQNGFSYDCATNYDIAVGVAEKDCADWLPQQVLDDEEGLDITLLAHDSNGKQAMCMKWSLTFDGHEGWVPPPASNEETAKNMKTIADALANFATQHPAAAAAAAMDNTDRNNTIENRLYKVGLYLDSMTQVSHRCVPANEPGYWRGKHTPSDPFPNPFNPWGFPNNAKSVLQMRLGHAMLASTSVIHSIDRTMKDAWRIDIPKISHESCVPTIPGFPHCHVDVEQTWNMGPRGEAGQWGRQTLTHHIRSPDLMLIQLSSHSVGQYGDLGCGSQNVLV